MSHTKPASASLSLSKLAEGSNSPQVATNEKTESNLLPNETTVQEPDSSHATVVTARSRSVHSSNSNILAMVSAHSVPNKLASHHDSKDRLQVSSNKRLTMGQRSSFFRSSAILRSPPDLAKIKEYFRESVAPNERVHIRFYLLAYREIVKFLCALGAVLSFASKDIESKVNRMDELLSSEEKSHYLFLDDLLKYELENNIITIDGVETGKIHKGKRFGTRIMFRLHQAMAFLVHFFTNVREQPNAKMHTIVNEAYKDTISRNHGWLVRKTATLAFHAIPSRNSLINRIRHEGATESSIMDELGEIIDVTKYVYMVVANTFDTHSNIAVKEPKTLKPNTS